jgi:hypothetical protein
MTTSEALGTTPNEQVGPCSCNRPHERICGAATSNPWWVCHSAVRPGEQCWRHSEQDPGARTYGPVYDREPVGGSSWGVVTSLPKDRYRITEGEEAWDVWVEADRGFL